MHKAVALPWFMPPQSPGEIDKTATILGAGLAGCATAFHLAAGGWTVTLIDKNPAPAQGTSGNPAGIVKPHIRSKDRDINNYFIKNYQYFIKFFENLLERKSDIAHDLSGIYTDLESNRESHWQRGRQSTLSGLQKLNNAGWISPADFCKAQITALSGINSLFEQDVGKIVRTGGQWQCFSRHGVPLATSSVLVMATGHRLAALCDRPSMPLQPLAGQITLLRDNAISPRLRYAVNGNNHYIIPLPQGSYLCGASFRRNADIAIREEDHELNVKGLKTLFPEHRIDDKAILGGRCGVRSVSPDRLPVAGALPDFAYYRKTYKELHHGRAKDRFPPARYIPGLYMIGALGSHGISSSPYLGRLVSDIISASLGEDDKVSHRLLHPARFIMRQLRRKPFDRTLPASAYAAPAHKTQDSLYLSFEE